MQKIEFKVKPKLQRDLLAVFKKHLPKKVWPLIETAEFGATLTIPSPKKKRARPAVPKKPPARVR